MATFRKRALVLASLGALGASAITLASMGELQRDSGVVVVPPPVVVTGGPVHYGFPVEPTFEIPRTWSLEAHVRFSIRGSGYPQWIPALSDSSHLSLINALLFTKSENAFIAESTNLPRLLINLESSTQSGFVIDSSTIADLALQLNVEADTSFSTSNQKTAQIGLELTATSEKEFIAGAVEIPAVVAENDDVQEGQPEVRPEVVKPVEKPEVQTGIFAHTTDVGSVVLSSRTKIEFVTGEEPAVYNYAPEIRLTFVGEGSPNVITAESPKLIARFAEVDFTLTGTGSSAFAAQYEANQDPEEDYTLELLALVQAIVEADEDDQFYY